MPIRRTAKKFVSQAAWHGYNIYRKGYRYRSGLADTAAALNAQRSDILAFQRERLGALLQHAYRTTPYYRDLLKRESTDISEIPPLEKMNVRTQLESLCSESVPPTQRIRNATGGSTGAPLVFYQDRDYWNQRNMSVYYFDGWAGWNFGDPQLIIWGALADLQHKRHWKHRLNDFWRNQHWLNGFQLTDQAMQATFQKMDSWQPQTLLAYPSSLHAFAAFLTENGLVPKWNLKGIITSAEMLHPHYRDLAESVFRTKVYNRYGSREVGLIAMECHEGRMHINCHDLYIEVDSPDPYAEPGDLLITHLNNYTMPLIRYRIGDIGRLSDEICPCGNQLPILGALLGRSTATFRTRTGTRIHGGYFTQQFYNALGVDQFQLIQESFERCVLKLVINTHWQEATRRKLVQQIQDALGADVVVKVEFVSEIPLPISGKREFTISKVSPT